MSWQNQICMFLSFLIYLRTEVRGDFNIHGCCFPFKNWEIVCEKGLKKVWFLILEELEQKKSWKRHGQQRIECTFQNALLSWHVSSKVIYPNYSKHWLTTVAHTIDCVYSKILNHGLNHGLLFSLFLFFGWKKNSK